MRAIPYHEPYYQSGSELALWGLEAFHWLAHAQGSRDGAEVDLPRLSHADPSKHPDVPDPVTFDGCFQVNRDSALRARREAINSFAERAFAARLVNAKGVRRLNHVPTSARGEWEIEVWDGPMQRGPEGISIATEEAWPRVPRPELSGAALGKLLPQDVNPPPTVALYAWLCARAEWSGGEGLVDPFLPDAFREWKRLPAVDVVWKAHAALLAAGVIAPLPTGGLRLIPCLAAAPGHTPEEDQAEAAWFALHARIGASAGPGAAGWDGLLNATRRALDWRGRSLQNAVEKLHVMADDDGARAAIMLQRTLSVLAPVIRRLGTAPREREREFWRRLSDLRKPHTALPLLVPSGHTYRQGTHNRLFPLRLPVASIALAIQLGWQVKLSCTTSFPTVKSVRIIGLVFAPGDPEDRPEEFILLNQQRRPDESAYKANHEGGRIHKYLRQVTHGDLHRESLTWQIELELEPGGPPEPAVPLEISLTLS